MAQGAEETWPCATEGCANLSRGRRHKYCETCHKRRMRQSARRRPTYTSPEDRAEALALALTGPGTDTDEGARRARKAFHEALRTLKRRAREEAIAEYVSKSLGAWEGGMQAPRHDVPASRDAADRGSEQRENS